MSELQRLIRLKEKEHRVLEFSLVAHRCQDLAGAAMAQRLQAKLENKKAEQQVLYFVTRGIISIRA